MVTLIPELHELVGSAASRTMAQLHEFGVDAATERRVRVGIVLDRSAGHGRRLLASALTDMLLRLDPLIGAVVLDMAGAETPIVEDLVRRLPLRVEGKGASPDLVIRVGPETGPADLTVDAAGWVVGIGAQVGAEDDGNPVGPLAGASLAAGETFKIAFGMAYPDVRLRMEPWRGTFSFASFAADSASPPLGEVVLDATLVGVGGVGAGFVRAIAALGGRVSGILRLVDADTLTTDNLNRVSFASLAGVLARATKVTEAEDVLARCCPRLHVFAHEMRFDEYKRSLGSREERRYDVVVTGLDDDEARREVQRDLPRILIDGSTGRDMVARVERVEFGKYGCLGCSRPNTPARDDQADCDAPPDPHAPSLSFLSAFPGVLAAGEAIKEVTGMQPLRGRFDHVFRYGPNPDMRSTPGIRKNCAVQCRRPSKLAQYGRKYASDL